MFKYLFILVISFSLVACGGEGQSSSGGKTVLSVQKSSLSTTALVSINQKISLTFNSVLNPESVNGTTVYIVDDKNNPVGTVVEIEDPFSTVVLTPYEFFKPSAIYTIVVTTQVKNSDGLSLHQEYRSSFTTASDSVDSTPLNIRAFKPDANATDVLPQTAIVIDFNKNLSAEPKYTSDTLLEVTDSSGKKIDGSYEVFNSLLKFKPSQNLPPDTNITVTFVGTVSDMYGTLSSSHPSWTFTTNSVVENSGFGTISSLALNKSASIVRTIYNRALESKIAVANGNKIDFYTVNFTQFPTKPTFSFVNTLTLGSQINSMESFSSNFLLVGTMNSGVYVVESNSSAIQNYLPNESIYSVKTGIFNHEILDRAYAVGPNFGLEVFDLNETTGVLTSRFFADTNITGVAIDVLDATSHPQGDPIRKLYLADYSGKLVVLDENASLLLKTPLNGSVKKLLSDGLNIFTENSAGIAQIIDFDGSIIPSAKMGLSGEVEDVLLANNFVYNAQGLNGISVIDNYTYQETYMINTGGDVVSMSLLNQLPKFLVTLDSDGVLNIFNANVDDGNQGFSSSPADGNTSIAVDTNITITINDQYLDTATISKNSFTIIKNDANATLVDFNLSVTAPSGFIQTPNPTYTLIPDSNLSYDTNYTVVINGNISNMLGNKISSGVDRNISFTTAQ